MSTTARRSAGTACLLAAIVMLLVGEFVLKTRLVGLVFLLYWLTCLGFTVGAIVMALKEVRAIYSENRENHRALIESTLREIDHHKNDRRRPRR